MEQFTDDSLVQIAPAKNLNAERSTNLLDHFPFSEVRENQAPVLNKLAKWTGSTKKFAIVEGPTGFGKSPVDIAMASFAKTMPGYGAFQQGAYVLTPQKSLAEQYMKDFAPMGLVELKGRNNYHCEKHSQLLGEDVDCEIGGMLNESSMDDSCTNCPYRNAKDQFMHSPFGTTNFDYYLHESNHAHQLADRTMLILDEAHNTEDKILGLTDTTINQRKCEEYGIVGRLPIFDAGDTDAVLLWLNNTFMPAAIAHSNDLAKKFKTARDEERAKVAKKIKSVERFIQTVNMFRNSEDIGEWFVWSDWDEKKRGNKGTGDLTIKPLTARLFADKLMFSKASKVLLTSATVLDFRTFMRNLGIADSDAECIAVDSDFPVENRPIFFRPVGDMRYQDIDETLPKMVVAVEQLIRKHATKKGIVHTNSYKINRFMVNYLMATDQSHRIITHDNAKGAREAAIARHLASPEPTVLISPSMTEGLDLKEDLSRFCIICKVPYPALDPYVRARMQRDPEWYQWQTSLKLVQATGRSVRSKTDKAITYILDAGFAKFIRANNRKMPQYWVNSIIW